MNYLQAVEEMYTKNIQQDEDIKLLASAVIKSHSTHCDECEAHMMNYHCESNGHCCNCDVCAVARKYVGKE